jgi:hypothetical protein
VTSSYAPDVEAQIQQQIVEAEVERIKSGGLDFGKDVVADGALESGTSLVGSMQMASDPGSRDKVTLYSTIDGLPSQVLVNMLGKKLAQKLPNGNLAWSRTQTVPYKQGEWKCLLHTENPRRKEFDEIGLAGKTCTKSNIASAFEVRQHMLHRHHQEWQVMEEARAEREREEDREFRRALMAAQAPRRGRPPKEEGDAE